jgi:hypothetical protein
MKDTIYIGCNRTKQKVEGWIKLNCGGGCKGVGEESSGYCGFFTTLMGDG